MINGSPCSASAAGYAIDAVLVFLDVDGTLIPFRARPASHTFGTSPADPCPESGNPLLDRLDPADGRRLLNLGCALVWATTWMSDANAVISPRLGLPKLPVVGFPEPLSVPGEDSLPPDVHWKTQHLMNWAAGRPFIWLDDEATGADQRWVRNGYPAPALVHRVDPLTALAESDFTTMHRWLSSIRPQ
ncbi:HAD domain-containing protein [Actinoplanes sp. NPDC051859]|uniref:HAD domain-containing protein n=1 Tax=Actinoplanes sp. NPDC051859 TaxID=3363909 RepID=UPI003788159F